MRVVCRRIIEDRTIENRLQQIAYYSIRVLGLMLAFDDLGLQPQTVVTGLVLTGLALGFALEGRFWTGSRRSDFTATRAAVRHAVVSALKAADIRLPEPDVRVVVPADPARWRAVLEGLRA